MKNLLKRKLHNQQGGIATVIVIVIVIILSLAGLSYGVFQHYTSIKDTSDRSGIEQQKLNRMMSDPNVVTGSQVKQYDNQASAGGYSVTVFDTNGTTSISVNSVVDSSLFKATKTYNSNGELSSIRFTKQDLSQ